MSNMANHAIETIEATHGVLVYEYDIRPDSGGAGRWRGGVGQMISVEFLRDGGLVVPRGMERMRFPAWGVAGGRPAAPFRTVFNPGGPGERTLPKLDQFPVNRGDRVTMLMPGAAGYGDPLERDPEAVRRDVAEGFVGRDAALADYGVVLDAAGDVDHAATRKERSARRRRTNRGMFDFGPEREAWEAVFDDAFMDELNRRLRRLPRAVRYETRRRLFERIVPELTTTDHQPRFIEVLADVAAVRNRRDAALEEILP